ncbi:aminotransferase class III-fold pyridoxal phosphate-dependent enzyme [Staphylococcus pseudintermedius]|nr:aminotransferase class III-fold pyridoxal phosphate-dependent enzyme [Staphylococcus pseudintermedius]
MKHETLVQKDRDYVWHPFTQMGMYNQQDPIIIEKGKGSYLYDTRGRKYLDGYASLWVNVHGHQNRQLNRAIQRQLNQIAHSTLLGSSNVPSILLAEQLVTMTPERLQKVFYSDTGSAAVEIAIKMAYQYWKNLDAERYAKKNKFLTLHQAYHGDTIGSVSVGGIDTFHRIFKDLIFENIQVPCPSFYHSDYASEATMVDDILKQIEAILQARADEIVGFVIEPLIQGATGLYVHPEGFLKAVEQLCRKYNILLINDAHAKQTFFHGHTYTGNQVVCAVALENIRLFQTRHLIHHIEKTSTTLRKSLETLSAHPHVGNIRGRGLMYAVELVENCSDKTPLDIAQVEAMIAKCKQEGLMIRNLENIITFVPVLSMSNREIKKMVRIFKKALHHVLKER